MKYENGVLHIIRGDDEQFTVTIQDDEGQEYEMQDGDTLTLTVRKKPEPDSEAVISVTSQTNVISIPHAVSEGVEPGTYSADVQLTFADGRIKTIWNGVNDGNHGKVRNWKNFCVDAEVTQ